MSTDILRYPIGAFTPPLAFTADSRAACIAQLAALPSQLRAAVRDLSDAELDTPYREGGWTVRQVVYHLGDSHLNCLARVMLGLTELRPTIRPYDETAWVAVGDLAQEPIEQAVEFVEQLHARLVRVARTISDQQAARTIVHPDSGEMSVDGLLALYAWHGAHHLAHITALRDRRGW